MCGRFTLATPPAAIQALFGLPEPPDVLRPRYNVAPRQLVAAVEAEDGARRFEMLSWGLLRSWAKDQKFRPINAMAETVAEKPMFRDLFKKKRCLVAADGFYEWRQTDGGKQPFHIRLAGGGPMAFAGLWDVWTGEDGTRVASCCVITTEANELVRDIHNRMPVIIPPADFDAWLDPNTPKDALVAMLRPYPADRMEAVPVSTTVNKVANEGPELITPAA